MKKHNGVYNISPYSNNDFTLKINDEVLYESEITVSSDFFNVELEKTYYNDLAKFTKFFYVVSSEQLGDGTITFSYNGKILFLKMHCGFYSWENSKRDNVENIKKRQQYVMIF